MESSAKPHYSILKPGLILRKGPNACAHEKLVVFTLLEA